MLPALRGPSAPHPRLLRDSSPTQWAAAQSAAPAAPPESPRRGRHGSGSGAAVPQPRAGGSPAAAARPRGTDRRSRRAGAAAAAVRGSGRCGAAGGAGAAPRGSPIPAGVPRSPPAAPGGLHSPRRGRAGRGRAHVVAGGAEPVTRQAPPSRRPGTRSARGGGGGAPGGSGARPGAAPPARSPRRAVPESPPCPDTAPPAQSSPGRDLPGSAEPAPVPPPPLPGASARVPRPVAAVRRGPARRGRTVTHHVRSAAAAPATPGTAPPPAASRCSWRGPGRRRRRRRPERGPAPPAPPRARPAGRSAGDKMAGGNRNTTGGRWRGPATTRRAAPRRGVEFGAPPGRDGTRGDAAAGPGRGRAGTAPQPRRSRGPGATRASPGAGAGRETRRRPVRSGDGAIRAPRFAGGAPPAVRSRPGARCQRARANGRAAQHACCPPHGRPAPPRALKGPRPPRPTHVRAPRLRRGCPAHTGPSPGPAEPRHTNPPGSGRSAIRARGMGRAPQRSPVVSRPSPSCPRSPAAGTRGSALCLALPRSRGLAARKGKAEPFLRIKARKREPVGKGQRSSASSPGNTSHCGCLRLP